MNAPERIPLPDVQSQADVRGIALDAAGVSRLRYPVNIHSGASEIATVANWSMSVALAPGVKGTHMSRFVELLEGQTAPLDLAGLRRLALEMLRRLDARQGTVALEFPWFVRKHAPVSGVASLLDCDVRWRATVGDDGACVVTVRVVVPVTALCPCSKDISEYGAHNQRSHVTIEADLAADMDVGELVAVAERSASCEVYGLLKRVDEKHVTERAYDNPRFAEDLVREVAAALDADPRIAAFVVEAENFESIHNHSAIARVVRPTSDARGRIDEPARRRAR